MAFRTYDPTIGRFQQIDPLADNISTISPYHFGYDNPIRFSDPLGLIGNDKEKVGADGLTNAEWVGFSRPSGPTQEERSNYVERRREESSRPTVTVGGQPITQANNPDVEVARLAVGNYVLVFYSGYFFGNSNINSGHYNAGIWTSGSDGWDQASIYVGMKSLGIDVAALQWKYMSNATRSKEAYNLYKSLKNNIVLQHYGVRIPKTSVIKTSIPGVLSGTGKVLGGLSGLITVGQVIYNGEIKASNVLDATMTAASFIPVVGWAIGGGYFIADVATRMITDKSIGEHLDAEVGDGGSLYKFD